MEATRRRRSCANGPARWVKPYQQIASTTCPAFVIGALKIDVDVPRKALHEPITTQGITPPETGA